MPIWVSVENCQNGENGRYVYRLVSRSHKNRSFHLPEKELLLMPPQWKIRNSNRKFGFLTKFYIVLVYLMLHLSTPMTRRSPVTYEDSFTLKLLKTIHISKYFIWKVKFSQFLIFPLLSLFLSLILNLTIEISMLTC